MVNCNPSTINGEFIICLLIPNKNIGSIENEDWKTLLYVAEALTAVVKKVNSALYDYLYFERKYGAVDCVEFTIINA